MAALKFTEATPIQLESIPHALAGRDILASASTGSGKSAAFGLPILNALIDQPRGVSRALILCPTRELAQQITLHLRDLAKFTDIRIAAIYGGMGYRPQINALKAGVDIIVATPGRLVDLMQQGVAKLGNISILVLDEADRMLDMGFLPMVRRIAATLPTERQTLFFSATIPDQIVGLTRELLHDPVRVNLTPTSAPLETIAQAVYGIDQHLKTDLLVDLLKKDGAIFSAIVFTRTKHRADKVAAALARSNVMAERIHGDRSQAQRTRALEAFKRGKYRVLVATDIAARGIDINDLGHVVNYDVPSVPEDYTHRIGRTARAQKTGDAITFVSREEEELFAQIERAIGRRLDRSSHPLAFEPNDRPSTARAMTKTRRSFSRRRR